MPRTRIVSVFAGCGKTEMARRHPDLAIDMESSDYRWVWPPSLRDASPDDRKGRVSADDGMRLPNPEWPNNYVDAICEEYGSGRREYVLVSMHPEVLEMLVVDRGLPVLRVYPPHSDRDAYLERYRRRGNAEPFAELMGRMFDTVVVEAEREAEEGTGDRSIAILKSGEFLEGFLLAGMQS